MDGRAWKAAVHGVAEGQTQLSDFPFTFHFHALEGILLTQESNQGLLYHRWILHQLSYQKLYLCYLFI